eukprot:TRINITY_DN29137_c0_g1_i1.p1 TRINITY_DN29137_c0_g1~~TRINITY_DN29137_c0_g1_i1.p1  ORF type:complete len:175 (-),score=37.27 TRINITY_DN29137_c0_g1_i1:108-611(-)
MSLSSSYFQQEDDSFCTGDGTDMFMKGFSISLAQQEPCVALLWQNFVLNTKTKFIIACVGVLAFGVVLEGLICFRRSVEKKWVKVILFMLNITGGYFAMLVAMTYCVELFICIIGGQALGHAVFNTGQDDTNEDTEDTKCDTEGVTCHGNKENPPPPSYNSISTDNL